MKNILNLQLTNQKNKYDMDCTIQDYASFQPTQTAI